MTTVRCPACAAAVAADAPWCTLCFADLRPPVSAPEPVTAPATPAATAAALAPHPILDGPILDGPVMTQADIKLAEPGWPCQSCGESVALDLTECPLCGGGFLGGARVDLALRLPGVGDVVGMSPAGRVGVMAGGAVALTVVLFLLYLLLGHFV